MRCKFCWIATALLVICAAAVQILQAEEPVRARVYVAKDATDEDVLKIRDSIITLGGAINGYARGEVFVIAAPPEVLVALSRVHHVVKVDVMPTPLMPWAQGLAAAAIPASARVTQMPRYGITKATPEQLAEFAKPAPKVKPNEFAKRRSLLMGLAAPPSVVDNSISPHFPPIGEQQWPATCATWAAGYYWSTYTQAADEGLDVSGVWLPRDPPCNIYNPDGSFNPTLFAACLPTIKDPPRPSRATEHIASPAFLYPLVHLTGMDSIGNCTTDDAGATLTTTMAALTTWGIGSWQMKPYDPWRSDPLIYEWPTEAQWVEALQRRTVQTFYFNISNASDMASLKQHLANGNLAVAGFHQYTNVWTWGWDRSCQSQPDVCPGMNNDVLYSNVGSTPMGGEVRFSGHAITIVGYDDNKSYFDAAANQTKYGAFLIANSAGPDWGIPNTAGGTSNGFFWMAYEYAEAELYEVSYNTDRPAYRPRLYVAARLEAPNRTPEMPYFRAGVGFQVDNPMFFDGISPYAKFVTPNVFPRVNECTPRPIESEKRLVIDLTDGLSQINLAGPVPLLFVTFNSVQPDTAVGGKMGPTDFFLDRAGDGNFSKLASPDPVKTALFDVIGAGIFDAVMCTNVPQNGDVTGDGVVDRTDISAITSTLGKTPQCLSDPRDMDRDSRITVIDARRAVTRCTYLNCQPR